jgi:hypothetical protein
VAIANALRTFFCCVMCVPSVTAATAAAETTAAAGCFFREVDVIVERARHVVCVEAHFRAREHIALPGLHTEVGTTTHRKGKQGGSRCT